MELPGACGDGEINNEENRYMDGFNRGICRLTPVVSAPRLFVICWDVIKDREFHHKTWDRVDKVYTAAPMSRTEICENVLGPFVILWLFAGFIIFGAVYNQMGLQGFRYDLDYTGYESTRKLHKAVKKGWNFHRSRYNATRSIPPWSAFISLTRILKKCSVIRHTT